MRRIFISSTINDLRSHRALVEASLFREQLRAELRSHSFEVINTWDNQKDVDLDWGKSSLNLIATCDLFLAFIYGNIANVLLELGYAMGIGKPVLIVSLPNKELPPDLLNVRFIKANSFDISLINRIIHTLDVLTTSGYETKENRLVDKFIDIDSAYKAYLHKPNCFDQIDYKAFEDLVYQWLKANEFDPERIKNVSDGGADFIAHNYKGHAKTLIELKKLNMNGRVSINHVQQFIGAIEPWKADWGIFITTSDFTDAAKAFADSSNANVELWNLEKLFKVLRR